MPDRLSEIERRVNEATPGPWKYTGEENSTWGISAPDPNGICGSCDCGGPKDADGAFIAHSRTDIEWLVRVVKKADKIASALRIHGHGDCHGCKSMLSAYSKVREGK